MLVDAGLVEGAVARGGDNSPIGVAMNHMTLSGHDFLDAARDDNLWKKAKQNVNEAGRFLHVRDRKGVFEGGGNETPRRMTIGFIFIGLLVAVATLYLRQFVSKKAENLAQKQDLADLTTIVERESRTSHATKKRDTGSRPPCFRQV
jgi:hypothetical protein